MRNTISTNSATMRAMITPMNAPKRLVISMIMPTNGLKAMVPSDVTGRYKALPLEQVAEAEHASSFEGISRFSIPVLAGRLHFAIAPVNRSHTLIDGTLGVL
jgi:hypothetical protein